jgi:hypothetical protein
MHASKDDICRIFGLLIVFFLDIPNVSDKDFSITLNAYFNVKWKGKGCSKDIVKQRDSLTRGRFLDSFETPLNKKINLYLSSNITIQYAS